MRRVRGVNSDDAAWIRNGFSRTEGMQNFGTSVLYIYISLSLSGENKKCSGVEYNEIRMFFFNKRAGLENIRYSRVNFLKQRRERS